MLSKIELCVEFYLSDSDEIRCRFVTRSHYNTTDTMASAEEFYYETMSEDEIGPVSFADMRAAFAANEFDETCLVWTETMVDWQAVEELPTLLARLNNNNDDNNNTGETATHAQAAEANTQTIARAAQAEIDAAAAASEKANAKAATRAAEAAAHAEAVATAEARVAAAAKAEAAANAEAAALAAKAAKEEPRPYDQKQGVLTPRRDGVYNSDAAALRATVATFVANERAQTA
jgi:hypothetical protein